MPIKYILTVLYVNFASVFCSLTTGSVFQSLAAEKNDRKILLKTFYSVSSLCQFLNVHDHVSHLQV